MRINDDHRPREAQVVFNPKCLPYFSTAHTYTHAYTYRHTHALWLAHTHTHTPLQRAEIVTKLCHALSSDWNGASLGRGQSAALPTCRGLEGRAGVISKGDLMKLRSILITVKANWVWKQAESPLPGEKELQTHATRCSGQNRSEAHSLRISVIVH